MAARRCGAEIVYFDSTLRKWESSPDLSALAGAAESHHEVCEGLGVEGTAEDFWGRECRGEDDARR